MMKYFFSALILIFSLTATAQESLSSEMASVMITEYLGGYQSGDTIRMKRMTHPNLSLQTAYRNTAQEQVLLSVHPADLMKYVAAMAKENQWEFRVQDTVLQVDGNIASVWVPFQFYQNASFGYCGAFSFTLTYTDDGWQILNVIESRRLANCLD